MELKSSPDLMWMTQYSNNNPSHINLLNEKGETLLSIAAEMGNKGIVQFLLENGADANFKNSDGSRPVHSAAKYGHKDIVKLFLDIGTPVDCCDNANRTPLIVAVLFQEPLWKIMDVVNLLIERGANVDFPGTKGQTVLHHACEKGFLELVRYLINKGCDLNPKDSRRNTPLLRASYLGHTRVIQYLVESGADVEYSSRGGFTVLHRACGRGWLGVVKAFINKELNLNVKDSDTGDTALHVAIANNKIAIVEHLLKAGADCNVKNYICDTALSVYIQNVKVCNVEIVKLFIENGGYFEPTDDYISVLRPILKDVNYCIKCIINEFNNEDLPRLYEIREISHKLPRMEKLKISYHGNVAQNIEQSVLSMIHNKEYCDVLNVRPSVLQSVCVKSLVKHYNILRWLI